jgi:hypothetical protein
MPLMPVGGVPVILFTTMSAKSFAFAEKPRPSPLAE